MKNKLSYLVLAAGIVLIVVGLARKDKSTSELADIGNLNGEDREQELMLPDNAYEENGLEVKDGGNYLEGVLNKSDDLVRGNFKLVSKLGDIYLKTSKDFSSLVGLQVLVLINGTQENFELLDIQSKIADDGFIRSQ